MKRFALYIAIIVIIMVIIILYNYMVTQSDNISPKVNMKFIDDLTFFIISDHHYMSRNTYDKGKSFDELLESGNIMIQYSNEFIEALKERIIEYKPNFIVFTGDLTYNGLKESHIDFSKKLTEISQLGTNVYVIPGNHDIGNKEAMFFLGDKVLVGDSINKDKFVDLYMDFGYKQSISRDKDSLSYLVKGTEELWLLMIDSTNDYPDHGGAISLSTIEWIESCHELSKENNSRMIAVMHHSLIDHSKIIKKDYTITNNEDILKLFHKCDIDLVLTGHIHLQDIKENVFNEHIIYDIATGCICAYPHQFGMMKYVPNDAYYYNTVKLNMEDYAIDNWINDEFLIDFSNYAESFFIDNCCKNQRDCINAIDELSESEKLEVIKVVSEMNRMYFAGYRNEELDYLKDEEGFKLIHKISTCPVKNYALSIINDERSNNNILTIPIIN